MFQFMKWLFLLGAALIIAFVLYLSIITIRKILYVDNDYVNNNDLFLHPSY